jgi:hypothetical protein
MCIHGNAPVHKGQKTKKELIEFIGYEKRGGNNVAMFKSGFNNSFCLDKRSLKLRIKNLKAGGFPSDISGIALENWPKETT